MALAEFLKRLTNRNPRNDDDRRWLALRNAARAAAAGQDGLAGRIVAALSQAGAQNFALEEKSWIGRIEERRRRTNASTEVISYRDYGARSPDASLTAAEMAEGVIVERTVGEIARGGSKPPASAAFLFSLIRQQKPVSCVEMGTCVGVSGSYIAAALELNGRGKLTTLDGAATIVEIARRNFAALELQHKVSIVVGPFHETLLRAFAAAKPIDFLFVDGHHAEQPTKDYARMMRPFLADQAIVVYDDINWSDGMKRAWDSIRVAPHCTAHFSLPDLGITVVEQTARHRAG